MSTDKPIVRASAYALLCLTLYGVSSGCIAARISSIDARPKTGTPSTQNAAEIAEARLLDVGILLFDPNIPEDWRTIEHKQIQPDVRKAEAILFSSLLKEAIAKTKKWGVTRVLPRKSNTFEVQVAGIILYSDGTRLSLRVQVSDASGKLWFNRTYKQTANSFSYETKHLEKGDPFADIYTHIAADMLAYYRKFNDRRIERLRHISRISFAQEFSPEGFAGYLKKRGRNSVSLARIPAEEDPQYKRIKSIRAREHLFVDTLDEHYSRFYSDIKNNYTDWRKLSYEEILAKRKLRAQAIVRGIFGVASVVTGVLSAGADNPAARRAGDAAILAGSLLIHNSLSVGSQAKLHSEAIRELGASFSVDTSDRIIETEDSTITLTGTVEAQYDQLRAVLKDIYLQEAQAP